MCNRKLLVNNASKALKSRFIQNNSKEFSNLSVAPNGKITLSSYVKFFSNNKNNFINGQKRKVPAIANLIANTNNKSHSLVNEVDDSEKYQCIKCNATFCSADNLMYHQKHYDHRVELEKQILGIMPSPIEK